MQTLQDLLLELNAVSAQQINAAIFQHSNVSLLESLARTLGKERETEIRSIIAGKLGIILLDDDEVNIEDELLEGVDPLQLDSLVLRHSALPLAKQQDAEQVFLLLALADPLNVEALRDFSALFNLPVKKALAREQAIKNAYASRSAMIVLNAREQLAAQQETNIAQSARFVEDPEARKAQQQVAATAVKHNAERVLIDLESLFTKVEFHFEDKRVSNVEISVASSAFLASFLRRGQVVSREDLGFEAACRIDFKSSAVYCTAAVRSLSPAEKGAAPHWKWLEISDFSIEGADDPNFWQSISEEDSFQIRRLFKPQSGIVVLCGAQKSARELAAHALFQSYPDLQLIECSSALTSNMELIEQGKEGRVLAIVESSEVWTVLQEVLNADPVWKSALQGVISYYHLPRICECCAIDAELLLETKVKIPSWANVRLKQDRSSLGCMVCMQKGFLGVTGACSVFVNEGEARLSLLELDTEEALPTVLAGKNFTPLLDSALSSVRSKHTSLSAALEGLPELPQAIAEARMKYLAGHRSASSEALQVFRPQTSIREEKMNEAPAQDPFQRQAISLGPVFDDELVRSEELIEHKPDSPLLLIIDDDADQRSILRRVFELEGYRVEAAADGIDGIVSANRLRPQLIIVDFMMPDLDGRETVRRLKKNSDTSNIPILALTAYPDPDVEYGLLKAGANDFCSKAVAKKVLLKRIARLLEE